jgi:integrase
MPRKRRGRSEGSVYQRSQDGLWVASVSAGYDGDGKRVRLTAIGRTKQEALDKLQLLRQRDVGMLGEAHNLTLAAYLKRWLEIVKPTVEPNTYDPYERQIRLHIAPVIGHCKLSALAPWDVESFYTYLTSHGRSPALVRKVGTTLTIALNAAVRLRLRDANPCLGVRKPKVAKPEFQVLDPGQVARFLDAAKQDRLYPFYLTMLDTGMRPGELFALGWEDVEFDKGCLQVRRSLEERKGQLRVKPVKTPKARRRIDLAAATLAALHEHRKRMLAEGHAGGPVFCNTVGTWLRIGDLTNGSFKPILARANARDGSDAPLPDIRLYDLRHTCATLFLLADVPAKVVSERLGHSTVTLTLDTYSHVLPTMQKKAAEMMNRILGRPPQAANG